MASYPYSTLNSALPCLLEAAGIDAPNVAFDDLMVVDGKDAGRFSGHMKDGRPILGLQTETGFDANINGKDGVSIRMGEPPMLSVTIDKKDEGEVTLDLNMSSGTSNASIPATEPLAKEARKVADAASRCFLRGPAV